MIDIDSIGFIANTNEDGHKLLDEILPFIAAKLRRYCGQQL